MLLHSYGPLTEWGNDLSECHCLYGGGWVTGRPTVIVLLAGIYVFKE